MPNRRYNYVDNRIYEIVRFSKEGDHLRRISRDEKESKPKLYQYLNSLKMKRNQQNRLRNKNFKGRKIRNMMLLQPSTS